MTELRSHDQRGPDGRRRRAPGGRERSRPNAPTVGDARPSLIVEDRLRLSLECLANARRLARLAGEVSGIPLLSDARRFARLVRQFTRAVERHLLAIKAALPASATDIVAPSPKKDA